MIPEARSRLHAIFLLVSVLLALALAKGSGEDGGAFGMDRSRLSKLIQGQDLAPVLALGDGQLSDTGSFGPAAYYFLAIWMDSRLAVAPNADADSSLRALFLRAYEQGAGITRREAGLALISRLAEDSMWDELLAFSADFAARVGAEWKSERPCLDALDALKNPGIGAFIAKLGSAYPSDSSKDAEALAYFAAAADFRSGGTAWPKAIRRMTLETAFSDWAAKAAALVRAEPRLSALFSEEELHALAMRDAVWRKDYGAAYREVLLAPVAAISRSASQPMIADAGKAFLYSGKLKEGAELFAALETAVSKKPVPTGASEGLAWTALYYRARFARALEQWDAAKALFAKAASSAGTKADADSARWYAADCGYSGAIAAAAAASPAAAKTRAEASARAALLDDLVAASTAWRDPATFSDLANELIRDALRARDWGIIEAMAERLGGKLGTETTARVSYAAARAFELGLGAGEAMDAGSRAAKAAVRFAAIADQVSAPLYYRTLAAWRAGIEPAFPPFSASYLEAAAVPDPPLQDAASAEAEAFAEGMASFGLVDLALADARSHAADIGISGLRRVATLFSSLGHPDAALRLEVDLGYQAGYSPLRSDYELLYPRPYLNELRSLRLEGKMPERLALGLIRSESVFKVDAVSRAGAIGLSQLMPVTAAEQAKALRLASFDLMNPKDNLAIGLGYFASLLAKTEGKPLRAMIAYNAGQGRLKTWIAESGDLPDDLFVEAIGIDETRQYCRNILVATVVYGKFYYGRGVNETTAELVKAE